MKPAMLALLLLSACGPLVQIGGNSTPPDSLLTLNATTAPIPYAGPAQRTDTIGVDIPGVPAVLQTLRLPVTTSATEVSYLVGAAWAEQPNRQFQRLLADTLAANGFAVVDLRQSNIAPARTVTGTLREFGLDVRDPANPVVRVRYDAQIAATRSPASGVALRRFEASAPASNQSPTAVAAALNQAANQLAAEVATWAKL
nr:ABC-type transport auxiliary lipoprotein family protein [Polymorphobacter sp.]